MAPTWYLGPSGDLRPLITPEVNFEVSTERYGGVFQGLSGARSIDVTGLKQKYTMEFKWLDIDEYQWFRAMHLRMLPGPYRLLNPFEKNRLSPESSYVRWGGGTANGVMVNGGAATAVYDFPSAASSLGTVAGTSMKWTNRNTDSVIRFDQSKKITVIPGEQVTASVWMKASSSLTMNIIFDWWNRTSQVSSSSVVPCSLTTSWQRFQITDTVPAGIHRANFAAYTFTTGPDAYFAAAQFEQAATATDWQLGGGAPQVHIDQMPTVTPRFPLRNITITLLEA